jgi:prepilin-type processing-associated H-X9-DG protein
MYTQDFDELMPAAGSATNTTCDDAFARTGYGGWIGNALVPYVKNGQVYTCPSDNAVRYNFGVGTNCQLDPRAFRVSYGYNYSGVGGGGSYPTCGNALAGALRPAELAILWDSANRWADGDNFYAGSTRDVDQYNAKAYTYGARHSEQHNVLYLDGHVKASRLDQLKMRNLTNMPDSDVRLDIPVTRNPKP